jgi:hypothetical protein
MKDCDMEEIENLVADEEIVRKAGYLSYARFLECQSNMAEGMIKFGSDFVRALGKALKIAQRDDALKIMRYWNNCAETHATLYKMYLARNESCHAVAINDQ